MNKEKENKNAEISARIAEILQYTGDTRNGFAVKLGYERAQTVYDVMNMKSAPSYDFFRRFSVSEYSDIIDLKWLLSGEGSMLCENIERSILPIVHQDSTGEASAYYKMYKEKDAKVEELLKENGRLEERIRQLESQNKESDSHSMIDKVAEAFTSESSSGYGEDFMPAKPPSDSKRSSAGKV